MIFEIQVKTISKNQSHHFFLSFTARFKICPAGEICVSWAEPLKCTTHNLFSSRVFLLNLFLVYKICLLKNITIFHSCCNLRYLLLISPYSLGLRDFRQQCSAVHSTYSLNVSRSRSMIWIRYDAVSFECRIKTQSLRLWIWQSL